MNTVEPIRNPRDIKSFKLHLQEIDQKYYMMFMLGINTGLRISDILKLTVADVTRDDKSIRDDVSIVEKKTSKAKTFSLNDSLKSELKKYIDELQLEQDEYLIYSTNNNKHKAVSRVTAYRILNDVARELHLDYKIGTHTLRKTFGYHFYKNFKDVAMLQKIFNHSAPSITLEYIGITQDEIKESYKNFSL